ncbi:MAG: hypothetical protein K6G26_08860 [Lachnospiraceae bacterium]|nr:hypothetical protein [Lachnospiraceae bacterium]
MIDNSFRMPLIYKKMSKKGLLDQNTLLWLDEMEWIPIDKILDYDYEEGESRFIVPFAHTARYDKWVWIINDKNEEYKVGLCETIEDKGIYYAKNMEDAILRHIIEYLASADFYKNNLNATSYQKNETELKKIIYEWKNQLRGILCDEYVEMIESFEKLELKNCSHNQGDWDALLSYEERDELINKYLSFDLLDKEFVHYEQ